MKLTKDIKILIIGLGVIGGSYAAALSKKGYHVNGITLKQHDLDYALERKMIENGSTVSSREMISQADLIILALYPDDSVKWAEEYSRYMKPGSLLSDVSGVKSTVIEPIQNVVPNGIEFISAHPMAGREQSGIEFSDPSVFVGANFIITPSEKNSPEAIEFCRSFAKELGFTQISLLSAKEHDEMIAFLSQLTHCIAVTLMTCNQTPDMEKYTGDSFRDLTRIAKINDDMWSKLFMANRDFLLKEMDDFSKEFNKFRNYLADGNVDEIRSMMRLSTARRSLFDKKQLNKIQG